MSTLWWEKALNKPIPSSKVESRKCRISLVMWQLDSQTGHLGEGMVWLPSTVHEVKRHPCHTGEAPRILLPEDTQLSPASNQGTGREEPPETHTLRPRWGLDLSLKVCEGQLYERRVTVKRERKRFLITHKNFKLVNGTSYHSNHLSLTLEVLQLRSNKALSICTYKYLHVKMWLVGGVLRFSSSSDCILMNKSSLLETPSTAVLMMYEAGLGPVHISKLAFALRGSASSELACVREMGAQTHGCCLEVELIKEQALLFHC